MLQSRALPEPVWRKVSHQAVSAGWSSMRVAPGTLVSQPSTALAK